MNQRQEFIRWGIIGCGDVVKKRVAAAIASHPRCRVVAACRRDAAALAEFCREFSVPQGVEDASDLCRLDTVDAVYVATPTYLHRTQAICAAERGKHVLLEKPMGMNVAECDEIIDACRRSGVKLAVAYYRRFYPVVARMSELLVAGEIGQPLAVTTNTSNAFGLDPGDARAWRGIVGEGGGGSLMDIGSHRIHLFQHLFGPIVSVDAQTATLSAPIEAEDTASLNVRFASGAHGTLHCFFGTRADLDDFLVVGRHGSLRVGRLNDGDLTIESAAGLRLEHLPPPGNLNAPQIDDFVDAILAGRRPGVDGEDGRQVNVVIEEAYARAAAR